jgi:hypothetical protein
MRRKRTSGMESDKPGKGQGNHRDNTPGMPVNGRVISYNLREEERPGGMKVRFKIRVETGKKAAARNAQQAEAIKELLQWARQHRTRP